jgi:hypothetical protein
MTNKLADHEAMRAALAARAEAFAKLDALDKVARAFARVISFAELQQAYRQFAAVDEQLALECFNTVMTQWLREANS